MWPYKSKLDEPKFDNCETERDRLSIAINDHRQRFNDKYPLALYVPPDVMQKFAEMIERSAASQYIKKIGFYSGVPLSAAKGSWTMTQIDGTVVPI